MQQFACVLFDMDTGHANAFHFAVNHDIQVAFAAKRYFCLGDLVCLWQVRVEVILSVLLAHAVDLAVHSVSHLDRIFHNLFIQGRKCSRHTHADRADLAVDFQTEGDFPKYGNDDPRADEFAVWLLKTFMEKIKKNKTYRNSEPTTSVLTITSNVVYGKATGALPDGRPAYTPFAPGASPSYGAEKSGLLASLNSVAKLPYEYALDGISNTQTMAPSALGHDLDEQKTTLVRVMDGYFDRGAHHLNVNVFGTEKLLDAQAHPEKPEYANFTIRVSGYAVKFISLTKEQQDDVIARTCHKSL